MVLGGQYARGGHSYAANTKFNGGTGGTTSFGTYLSANGGTGGITYSENSSNTYRDVWAIGGNGGSGGGAIGAQFGIGGTGYQFGGGGSTEVGGDGGIWGGGGGTDRTHSGPSQGGTYGGNGAYGTHLAENGTNTLNIASIDSNLRGTGMAGRYYTAGGGGYGGCGGKGMSQ